MKKKKHKFLLTCTAGLFRALYQAEKESVPQLQGEQPRSRLPVKLISKTFAMRVTITRPSSREFPKITSTV